MYSVKGTVPVILCVRNCEKNLRREIVVFASKLENTCGFSTKRSLLIAEDECLMQSWEH